MKIFLRAKHWQLFTVLYAVPFTLQCIFMSVFFVNFFREVGFDRVNADPDPKQVLALVSSFLPAMMIIAIIVAIVHFSWFYSLGVNLHKRLPASVSMPVRTFKAFTIIPVICAVLGCIGGIFAFQYISRMVENPPDVFPVEFIPFFFIVIPVELFCAVCVFYNFYFISKCLKAVEKQRDVQFGDYVGEFFCMWFSFVGVWIVQPRVNKLFKDDA